MVGTAEYLELWTRGGIEAVLTGLRDESVKRWGVPDALARRASAAVSGRIEWDDAAPERSRARTEAYYWAVLRRMALTSRDKDLAPLKARFALATIVEDMRARGMMPEVIRENVMALHADLVEECGLREGQLDVAC
jgi:hypothetical protein